MIKVKIFDDYCPDSKMEVFIFEHRITREQIISISFAVDANAHARYCDKDTQQIMLVWEDNK
jgi:hypothetical protein